MNNLGEIIRYVVHDDGRSAKAICNAVGMSRGNLDKIYKKNSINTDLLARLCVVLEHDFFQYVNPFILAVYTGSESEVAVEPHLPLTKVGRCLNELREARMLLDFLRREVAMLKAHNADMERVVSLQDEVIEGLRKELDQCQRQNLQGEN